MKESEEYNCPECGKGIVKQKIFLDYKTKIDNHSFTVPIAYIDVCDTCGCKIFSPQERERWTNLFYQKKEKIMAMNFWETNEGHIALKELGKSIDTHSTVMAGALGLIRQPIEDNTRALKNLQESTETHTTVIADALELIRQAIEDNTRSLEDIKKEMHNSFISILNKISTNSIIVTPQQSKERKKTK